MNLSYGIPYDLKIPKNFKGDIFELDDMAVLLKGLGIHYENQ
ncbi:hypothetical protein D347_00956 [Enterococcus faecalis LA3B-2]|nr:hypothetical protein D347_00956 [Enterococcus faecalis LA3B-2]